MVKTIKFDEYKYPCLFCQSPLPVTDDSNYKSEDVILVKN